MKSFGVMKLHSERVHLQMIFRTYFGWKAIEASAVAYYTIKALKVMKHIHAKVILQLKKFLPIVLKRKCYRIVTQDFTNLYRSFAVL